MAATSTELSGPQKVAVLLMQLGPETAAKVLQSLRDHEVADVMAEVARLRDVGADQVDTVLGEFAEIAGASMAVTSGGLDLVRTMLEASVGPDQALAILDRVAAGIVELPFEFLRRADPRQVLSFLQDEHPQTITLVLAHMPAESAALVMSGLSEELQRDVAHRLAVMEQCAPEVIGEVEGVLRRKLSSVLQSTELTSVGGVQSLVDILNRSDRATERLILTGLESDDADLADEVRQRMFVFEDVAGLDDRSIQLVLRHVDGKELAVALKGVRADVRDKILRNMSERAGENLREEMEILGPVRLTSVEEAQGSIVRVIRTLEESGQLVLARGADEFVV
ncbi:MAG: flagellar motor switch protein FliG [Acidimicrobiia bacterium]